MDIIEKAKELGTMIKESNQMVNLRDSEAKMMQDDNARTILNDLYVLQDEMTKAMQDGKNRDAVEDIKNRYIKRQNDMQNYEITRVYLENKSKFDGLMKQINDVIVYSMTGEEQCSGHDCGSCSCGCECE